MTHPAPIQLFRPVVSEDAINAVAEVLRSGWIGLGPKTAEFERAFAVYVGARHAVGVSSATAALHLALIVHDVGEGDEVLTTPLTFVSTNHVILYQKAVPVFVDVDPQTLNLDLTAAEACVTARTKAIMVVHYGGNPLDLDRLYAFAARHRLAVIEDAAHACGARWRGRRIGGFGTTCFSFHAVKNLPMGDGGMVTVQDEKLWQRLNTMRWLGIDRSTFDRNKAVYQWEYEVSEVGYKYHMNDIAAVIGLAHLTELDKWNARRAEIVTLYRKHLADLAPAVRFVSTTPGAESANHLCAIFVENRDQVVDGLRQRGVNVGVHYKPNHHYKPYRDFVRAPLPQADAAFQRLISLPLHLLLQDGDVERVCQTLRDSLVFH